MTDTEKYAATFALVDGDSDGLVSVDELHRLMQVLGQEVSEEKAAAILAELDVDGDGRVSLEEFAAFLESGSQT
ncbi:MAG TPA: EF-hand domain-containing protein [Acidimicrobiales bacterium]|nr:EF-hand domain-containing protein [Acidimicrobiales bacterium]